MPKVSQMLESKYLKQDDIGGGNGKLLTVRSFKLENLALETDAPERKWTMSFEELEKPLVLNSTNIQLCHQIFGSDDTDNWVGKQLVLFVDPTISFQGKLVGGLRVRAPNRPQGRQAAAQPPRQPPPYMPNEEELDRMRTEQSQSDF